jgi:hypothetical protein
MAAWDLSSTKDAFSEWRGERRGEEEAALGRTGSGMGRAAQ